MSNRLDPPAQPLDQAPDRARRALREGRLADAASLAREALSVNPGDVVAVQALGHALLMQNRAREAVDALRSSAAHSRDPAVETLLARALAAAGRREEALDQLRRTTSRRPVFVLAFLELGELLGRSGRLDAAFDVFSEGLALAPEAAVLRVGLGHLLLRRNDRNQARALFAEVLRAAPHRHDATVALAGVMELDGDYAGAADLYRNALSARPAEPTTAISLGRCLLELGEREAGEAVMKSAVRGAAHAVGLAIAGLAATPRGRLFVQPSAAARFLGVQTA